MVFSQFAAAFGSLVNKGETERMAGVRISPRTIDGYTRFINDDIKHSNFALVRRVAIVLVE